MFVLVLLLFGFFVDDDIAYPSYCFWYCGAGAFYHDAPLLLQLIKLLCYLWSLIVKFAICALANFFKDALLLKERVSTADFKRQTYYSFSFFVNIPHPLVRVVSILVIWRCLLGSEMLSSATVSVVIKQTVMIDFQEIRILLLGRVQLRLRLSMALLILFGF